MPEPSRQQAPAPPQENHWALRIATVAGIPIRLHFTFLLFLVYVALTGRTGGTGLSLGLVLALFLCVVLHELGHSLAALRYGIPVASITLYPIGGVAQIEKRPTAGQELWIALAGPAVNVVIAALLWGILAAQGALLPPEVVRVGGGGWRGFVEIVMWVNVSLVLFNMIPAFPMDGGRVLRAILALNMPPARATAIAAMIGQTIALLVGLYAISHPAYLWYLFIAIFVYFGAGQEAAFSKQASLIEGVTVGQAMMTDVRTLTVGNTLKEAADVLLDTSQHDFPVMHGDLVQGVLTRNGLLRGLAEAGPTAYVAGTMSREFASAGPDDNLGETLPGLQSRPGPLLVLDPAQPGRLLGIVTGENVQEFFAVRQIAARRTSEERG